MQWRIGCSGFHYKEWKGLFYPPGLRQKDWFEFYCRHFNTLELNMTFYRFPQVKFLRSWYDRSPSDFLFSVKMPRLITHYKRFHECERMLGDFYGSVNEGLGEKLGLILFQLPKQILYSRENLFRIIECVNPEFQNTIEFRDKSWWKKIVYKELARRGIVFCNTSYPGLPDDLVINTPTLYYRLHGKKQLYYSKYPKKEIQEIAGKAYQDKNLSRAFIYFDNTATGNAIINARQLQEIVTVYENRNSKRTAVLE